MISKVMGTDAGTGNPATGCMMANDNTDERFYPLVICQRFRQIP